MLLILSLVSVLLANPNQILKNGHLAYYGNEFYQKNQTDLKNKLHKILSNDHSLQPGDYDHIGNCQSHECYKHDPVGYDRARVVMFGELYKQVDKQGSYVIDVYCHKKIYFKQVSDISQMGNIINIEHTWPQSKFSKSFDKNTQKSDMHHLFPTDSRANSERANYEFGEEGYSPKELLSPGKGCERSQVSEVSGHFIFTPPMEHKGNVARALFYFSIRYKMPIGQAEEMILREWHRIDPIDEKEKENNNLIANHQKNRNPFIDFPELVDEISDF
jgi:deoxyribonuclease-1